MGSIALALERNGTVGARETITEKRKIPAMLVAEPVGSKETSGGSYSARPIAVAPLSLRKQD